MMPDLVPALNRRDIEKAVTVVAEQITSDYAGREPILIGVLNGAFVFLSDLVRRITLPIQIDFIRVSSYGSCDHSSGHIHLVKGIELDIRNRDVLVVEDIVDSGLTLKYITAYVGSFDPQSLKICTLINKHERRQADVRIDYTCHAIKKGFLVGYGLDYAEGYRNLPDIYHLKV